MELGAGDLVLRSQKSSFRLRQKKVIVIVKSHS